MALSLSKRQRYRARLKNIFHCRHILQYRAQQGGFSLLELLISLLIFSVGFIGIATLQHVSIKMTHDTVLQSSAMALADSLAEQLRVQGKSVDLASWQNRVQNELPKGKSQLLDQGGHYQIKVEWQESQYSDQEASRQEYEIAFSSKDSF